MGLADFDFLAKEWPVIRGAPSLVIGGIITIIAITVSIMWFLFSWSYRRQIDGLNAQFAGLREGFEGVIAGLNGRIAVFEDRLKCAAEKVELANQARAEVERQFKTYKEELATNAEKAALAVTEAKVDAAIDELAAANSAIGSAIGAARISAVSSMSVSLSNSPLPLREVIKSAKDG
jgi:hypothetical protein